MAVYQMITLKFGCDFMPLLIDVPYGDKEKVKLLGAKWKPQYKKWYIERKADYPKFIEWIKYDTNCYAKIICDYFYIVETLVNCSNCNSVVKNISLAEENSLFIINPKTTDKFPISYSDSIFFTTSFIKFLPFEALKYLKCNYNFYLDYKNSIDTLYYVNHCSECGIQINSNISGFPFYSKNTVFNKVKLKYDIYADIDISQHDVFSNINIDEYSIKKHSLFVDSGLEF